MIETIDQKNVMTKTKWTIDNVHSEIGFKVRHLMVTNVSGRFKEFGANISTKSGNYMTSDIDFWMNPASIDTMDENRDGHLRSNEFFDIENYKVITFKGTRFEETDKKGQYELFGNLTIKDVSHEIKLDVEFGGIVTDPNGNKKAGYAVKGAISRKDWGLSWNTALVEGGFLVSDQISINCEVQLVKQK